MTKQNRLVAAVCAILLMVSACTFGFDPDAPAPDLGGGTGSGDGESATVTSIIDGDTIDVSIGGSTVRVRYIGVNTPERDESCYREAMAANTLLVSGKTVRLVKDVSETDPFGRLLRYVYVGDQFINAAMVQQGYAESASYPPDTAHFEEFKRLEAEARGANRGCHPTGIFNDGSDTR